ncbi:hypothetical protein ACJZ2D_007511 [Fusarium nematophilum]
MARLSTLVLFGLLSLVVASPQYEEINRNAECDVSNDLLYLNQDSWNDCFFGSFPGGSCTNDDACMCTQQKYRERYFCCMAEKCAASVLPDSIERQTLECEARNMEFTFDVEKACGIKLTTTSSIISATTTSATTGEGTSTANGSANESSATSASTAAASTQDTTTETSSTGTSGSSSTGASEASSTESTTPVDNSASQARVMLNGVVLLVAMYAVLLW